VVRLLLLLHLRQQPPVVALDLLKGLRDRADLRLERGVGAVGRRQLLLRL